MPNQREARPRLRRRARALGAALLGASLCSCVHEPERGAQSPLAVSARRAATFEVDGKRLCFAGANNYYIAFKPKPMVDDVLASARALSLPVLRIWAYLDAAALDGSVPRVDPHSDAVGRKDGVYFQYWDPKQQKPRYNEGPNGLQRLDYALARARDYGVKLLLVLTNNWRDYGGMDQYLAWFGRSQHHEFYSDPRVKQAYKDWVEQLVLRKNTLTGQLYRDDPTIFGWELGNEPRCNGAGRASSDWTPRTLVSWADEMSRYIKTLDPNHLVSVGDEGFLARGGEHWTYRAQDGVDHEALTALPAVDFGTYHAYPEDWGAPPSWGTQWLVDHELVARRLDKPTVLEEYGVKVVRDERALIVRGLEQRTSLYTRWNDLLRTRGSGASLVWMLGGRDTLNPNPRGLYPDYDGYAIYRGDASARLLAHIARRFMHEAAACQQRDAPSARPPSAFVSVRRARSAEARTLDWFIPRG